MSDQLKTTHRLPDGEEVTTEYESAAIQREHRKHIHDQGGQILNENTEGGTPITKQPMQVLSEA